MQHTRLVWTLDLQKWCPDPYTGSFLQLCNFLFPTISYIIIPLQGPALRPSEVAVVCDNMLQGLGRYLRACGIDVKILSNNDDHDVAAKVRAGVGRGGGQQAKEAVTLILERSWGKPTENMKSLIESRVTLFNKHISNTCMISVLIPRS